MMIEDDFEKIYIKREKKIEEKMHDLNGE